ncbi:hypothetical protein D3C77_436050 [compost metagenome]
MLQTQRLHGRILRLKANMILLLVECLHRCLIVFGHCNDDLAIVGCLLLTHNNIVSAMNSSFNHAVANDG